MEATNACDVADLALDKYIAKDASVTGVGQPTAEGIEEMARRDDAEMIRATTAREM